MATSVTPLENEVSSNMDVSAFLLEPHLGFKHTNPLSNGATPENNGSNIPVQALFKTRPYEDIPATIAEDVFLSAFNETRYGYPMRVHRSSSSPS
jgi:hypothetical protein